jgi:hypothetical protein
MLMKPLATLSILSACVMLGSWTTLADESAKAKSGAMTANVYLSSVQLPAELKRVLVLPLAGDTSVAGLPEGCQMLDPVLQAALIKTGKFEVVSPTPEALRSCTGKLSWTGDEVLPQDFFSTLNHVYGCDGVLFAQLTTFRSSPPLAIGWRLKLADAQTGKILWAGDEIFDANNPVMAKSAQQFEKREQPHQSVAFQVYTFFAWCIHVPTRSALDDQWNILHSPRYFGEFSSEKLLQTLPVR